MAGVPWFVDPCAEVTTDKVALTFDDATRTYGDLEQRSLALARVIAASGAAPGAPVAVMLPNGFEIIEAGLATAAAGCAFLPVNRHLGADEVAWMVTDADTPLLISHVGLADAARRAAAARPGCRVLLVGDDGPDGYEARLAAVAGRGLPEGRPSRATPAYRFYTSGTTGRPRGVLRESGPERDDTGASARAVLRMWGITAADTFLVSGPLYHAAGAYAYLSLHGGATVAILPRFEATAWLALVEHARATVTLMVPAHFVRILEVPEGERERFDLRSLRLVLHAAAPCPVSVKQKMMAALPDAEIWEFYGASEGGATRISPGEWRAKPGSVGRPWPGVEVTVRDEEGNVLPAGSTGLVYMTSPRGRFRYSGEPSKTAAAWRGDAFTLGDIGHLDDDGYLYLTDRSVDVVIRGGVNVYPVEIEGVLAAHPAVVDCAVFGVPDERSGESIRALVELRSPVPVSELMDHCRQVLAAYKCPNEIIEVAELPRDEAGKVRKRDLRALAWEGHPNRIRTD